MPCRTFTQATTFQNPRLPPLARSFLLRYRRVSRIAGRDFAAANASYSSTHIEGT